MRLERRERLDPAEFLDRYLAPRRPVIVTDAVSRWPGAARWGIGRIREELGDERVQVYGDLFRLVGISTLREYMDAYFGKDGPGTRRYVRWYSRHGATDLAPWADEVFRSHAREWDAPYFAPRSRYILPYCPSGREISPSTHPFPARGLFVSARGARTRLHHDPWGSDAFLCQIDGAKSLVMYPPEQRDLLWNERGWVDIAAPDTSVFPRFAEARAAYQDRLGPGEVIYIPRGWLHHFDTVEDSVSLTWNFVHESASDDFSRYLASGPPKKEVDTIAYFWREAAGAIPFDESAHPGHAASLRSLIERDARNP